MDPSLPSWATRICEPPIAHALAWPDRMGGGVERLDLVKMAALEFQSPDVLKFPSLILARQAAETGGTLPAILNAGNEVGVQSFLDGEIRFDQIIQLVEDTMDAIEYGSQQDLESVLAADHNARRFAESRVLNMSQNNSQIQ